MSTLEIIKKLINEEEINDLDSLYRVQGFLNSLQSDISERINEIEIKMEVE